MFLDGFPTGPIQAQCVLLGDEDSGVVLVIDPGDEGELIAERVRRTGLEPTMILHTHGHLDHAGGTAQLAETLSGNLPIGLHPEDLDLYRSLPLQARMFGMEVDEPPEPTLELRHGQRIALGSLELEVRHAPGHSPGSVCFVVHGGPEPVVIVGDVLFAGSIGRTDLWGGSFGQLKQSILTQLYTLPDETRVVCGHGPDTTIGREKRTNPFVSA